MATATATVPATTRKLPKGYRAIPVNQGDQAASLRLIALDELLSLIVIDWNLNREVHTAIKTCLERNTSLDG